MDEKIYELKIESEIGGGSLSIFGDKDAFYKTEGFLNEKKSDYIIEVLRETLSASRIGLEEFGVIRYSEYPGSQMGLKILASIVKGVSLPHKINAVGKNIFESLFEFYRKRLERDFLVVLPINKREFAVEFSDDKASELNEKFKVSDLPELLAEFNKKKTKTVLPLKIFENMLNDSELFLPTDYEYLIDTGDNLSIYL